MKFSKQFGKVLMKLENIACIKEGGQGREACAIADRESLQESNLLSCSYIHLKFRQWVNFH